MLCEKCNQNPASVHTVTIVNGEKQEHHLCSECAGEAAQYSLPSMMGLLAGFGMLSGQCQQQPVCDCGAGFARFQKLGLLGCPACYTTYREQLLPVIKRAQGGRLRHVGRRPAGYRQAEEAAPVAGANTPEQAAVPAQQDECVRLRKELHEAIQEEHYERAAELRDRLRLLEGGAKA